MSQDKTDPLAGVDPETAAKLRERAEMARKLREATPGPIQALGALLRLPVAPPENEATKPLPARIPPPPPPDVPPLESYEFRVFSGIVRLPDVERAFLVDPSPEWPAIEAVDRWLKSGSSRHLLLRGGVGTGKSFAAAYAVKRWTSPDMRPLTSKASWLRPDELVSAVMHAYDDKSPELHKRVVIDDLGMERKADFSDALCDLLDRPGHRIVITTNLTKTQMRDRYTDERLRSRMNHLFFAVDIRGESRRDKDGGAF